MPILYLTTNLINNKKYIGADSHDNDNYYGSGKLIKLALKKYGTMNFKKETLEENDDIKYIFEREKYYIEMYNANNSEDFYNISEGGRGGNMLKNEDSINRWKTGIKNSIQSTLKNRKGKSYEEIYGKRSEEEKEKRRTALLGNKRDPDINKKISEKLKEKTPWNKGLTKEDVRVKKYIENYKHKEFLKIYELKSPEGQKNTFNGKEKLKIYIRNLNKNLKLKNRINIDNLIKNKLDKNFSIEIKKIM
jgi:hypothetical protein